MVTLVDCEGSFNRTELHDVLLHVGSASEPTSRGVCVLGCVHSHCCVGIVTIATVLARGCRHKVKARLLFRRACRDGVGLTIFSREALVADERPRRHGHATLTTVITIVASYEELGREDGILSLIRSNAVTISK